MLELLLVFILGLILGSFLNVCIYRMPLEQSIIKPASYCPFCKKTIPWYDNIPLLSYIILKARCRFCKERIPFRYFLVELLTGILCIFLFKRYGLGLDFVFYLLFCSLLIVASFIDIQHRIIPDEVNLGGIAIGLFFNFLRGFSSTHFNLKPFSNSLLGVLIGGGIIYLTGVSFDFIYFKLLKRPPIDGETESMGGGDVKFLAMIGAFLGWQEAVLTFFIAPFIGSVFGLANLFLTKRHTIPYGPFLALSAFICMVWAKDIIFYLLRI